MLAFAQPLAPWPDDVPSLRPRLPVRHWILRLAAPSVRDCQPGPLVEALVGEIFRSQRARAGRLDAHGAAVTLTVYPRAPGMARIVHALVVDGVVTRGTGEPSLLPLPEPPDALEGRAIARRVRARLLAAWPTDGMPRARPGGSASPFASARVLRIEQCLVEGPPVGPLGSCVASPILRVRLARPLHDGTTHAALSAQALLGRLRGLVGPSATGAVTSTHGILWPARARASPLRSFA